MNTSKIDLHHFLLPNMYHPDNLKDYPLHLSHLVKGGAYNGYVVCSRDHPWFAMDPEQVPVSVHCGLTYGRSCEDITMSIPKKLRTEDYWIYGWDTLHSGDTIERWSEERVREENNSLYWQFYEEMIKKLRDDKRV